MAAFNKFDSLTDYIAGGGINFKTDTLKVMLTNTAPVRTNKVYADVSGNELANGNGYTTGGATVGGTGSTNASGVESVSANAITFTSATGSMGPFRYAVFYDSSAAGQPLICWFDYGTSVTLNGSAGETFVLQPGAALLQLT